MSFGSNYLASREETEKAGRVLNIETAQAFLPLLGPSRYKGAHGGRGSSKSWFFAGLMVEECEINRGTSAVCIREVQKTIADSCKKTIENTIDRYGLGHRFKVFRDAIQTPGDGAIIFRGMNGSTADNIKSLEGFRIAWVDEAQNLSGRSLSLLRPTIRSENSELWFSWNPTRKKDAVDEFFRKDLTPEKKAAFAAICDKWREFRLVEANWKDNPWWTAELEGERLLELEKYPERYGHTYGGDYAGAFEGAYFAKLLTEARIQGRIGVVERDDMLPLRIFIDIGGAGAKADAFTMWVVQWVGEQIRVLDYYEARGQILATHAAWVREKGYEKALFYLPHDGSKTNDITGKRYHQHWEDAGFHVEQVVPNQGQGAASIRIENVRRLKNKYWFNEATTEGGRLALGFYHEKKDEERNIGLGPEHDWSSHGADAFGLMATCYEPPATTAGFNRKIIYPGQGYA